jgi:carboxyl-terminal processing protease
MKSNSFKFSLRSSVCIIVITFLLFGQSAFAADTANDQRNQQYLQSVIDMIREEYKGTPTDDTLIQGALKGLLGSLDPYTTYYTPKEADTFVGSITGVFGGIGVTLELSGDYVVITKVFQTSPAEKMGIIQGDKIVEVDGKSVVKVTPDDAATLIKGNPGTKVKLGILRNGSNTVKYFEIAREIIKVNPVTYEIRNGVGYIKLEMFNENSDEYLTNALAEMDKNKITKLVLDLRDNPGGAVDQAVLVAKKFVPKGLITKLDYKSDQYPDVVYNSDLEKTKYKLAVLVNGMSASASEIVSGAIQDTGAGKLIGTKTFGKAKFQGIFPILTPEAFEKYSKQTGSKTVNGYDLENQFQITPAKNEIAGYTKMTLGLYYTPKGRMIDEKGLTPDITVADPKPVAEISVNNIQKLTKTSKTVLNGQGIDVYNTEKLLKVLGYKIGDLDTTLDAKTAGAIKSYQKAKRLTVNGSLDFATQDALNADFLKLIDKYDTQYSAAVKTLNQ